MEILKMEILKFIGFSIISFFVGYGGRSFYRDIREIRRLRKTVTNPPEHW